MATLFLDKLTTRRLLQYTYQDSLGQLQRDTTATTPPRVLLPVQVASFTLSSNGGASLWSQKGFPVYHPS